MVSSDGVPPISIETVSKFSGEEDFVPAPSFFEPSPEKLLVRMRAVDITGIPLVQGLASVLRIDERKKCIRR